MDADDFFDKLLGSIDPVIKKDKALPIPQADRSTEGTNAEEGGEEKRQLAGNAECARLPSVIAHRFNPEAKAWVQKESAAAEKEDATVQPVAEGPSGSAAEPSTVPALEPALKSPDSYDLATITSELPGTDPVAASKPVADSEHADSSVPAPAEPGKLTAKQRRRVKRRENRTIRYKVEKAAEWAALEARYAALGQPVPAERPKTPPGWESWYRRKKKSDTSTASGEDEPEEDGVVKESEDSMEVDEDEGQSDRRADMKEEATSATRETRAGASQSEKSVSSDQRQTTPLASPEATPLPAGMETNVALSHPTAQEITGPIIPVLETLNAKSRVFAAAGKPSRVRRPSALDLSEDAPISSAPTTNHSTAPGTPSPDEGPKKSPTALEAELRAKLLASKKRPMNVPPPSPPPPAKRQPHRGPPVFTAVPITKGPVNNAHASMEVAGKTEPPSAVPESPPSTAPRGLKLRIKLPFPPVPGRYTTITTETLPLDTPVSDILDLLNYSSPNDRLYFPPQKGVEGSDAGEIGEDGESGRYFYRREFRDAQPKRFAAWDELAAMRGGKAVSKLQKLLETLGDVLTCDAGTKIKALECEVRPGAKEAPASPAGVKTANREEQEQGSDETVERENETMAYNEAWQRPTKQWNGDWGTPDQNAEFPMPITPWGTWPTSLPPSPFGTFPVPWGIPPLLVPPQPPAPLPLMPPPDQTRVGHDTQMGGPNPTNWSDDRGSGNGVNPYPERESYVHPDRLIGHLNDPPQRPPLHQDQQTHIPKGPSHNAQPSDAAVRPPWHAPHSLPPRPSQGPRSQGPARGAPRQIQSAAATSMAARVGPLPFSPGHKGKKGKHPNHGTHNPGAGRGGGGKKHKQLKRNKMNQAARGGKAG